MSYETRFLLPSLGEGDGGGRIVNWLKQPGDAFDKDDTLLEVETDKAVIEVPAPCAGKVLEHVASVDDLVDFQDALARVEFEGEAPADANVSDNKGARDDAGSRPTASPEPLNASATPPQPPTLHSESRIFATPRARSIARERGVDLAATHGTGKGGRIVAADVPARKSSSRASPGAAVETSFDSRDRTVDIPHGRVFLREWQPRSRHSGATVFLVHGLFADVDAWIANAAVLARRGIPVVAMDLPGHGSTECGADFFEEIVGIVVDSIRNSIEGSVVLVGHSFGAAVAARAARQTGIDISGLVLIAPVGLGTEIEQSFIAGMLNASSVEALEREMRKLTVRPQTPGTAYLETLRARLQANSLQLEQICRSVFQNGVQQVNIYHDLDESVVPVRIIQGRRDAIVPWTHALNAPPRAALHMLPESGHMPQWEASALTMDIISSTC